ncbi:UDP-N-acetylmuramoyl-L-alanine--D-glutamate ligase [Vibrio sp. JC009]|uniref:UDP-N-acetylmuramoyl-L-alanine--D-glutamate ligase n=1 Tax=Vibrio sp. JC009 TaxID=2912314 RepID=UPI0023B09743|nr:UDP-N-acetylmuramoyl-L-alanine--D-glutamate ligase [Vibrio sp. JC009]WED21432.1 UDP-N-acetylmuramoyl-L-alanine--D-glutamate ligase [Vibrio sp. JC009]
MQNWNNINKVVVAGLGITGLSVVKYLTKIDKNLDIRVIDTRANPPGQDELDPQIKLHSGSWQNDWLAQADLIVVNPGIALATPEIQAAADKNIPIVGDIELFAWAAEAPVIAITGSNGKSTVTDLTGVMAKAAGLKVGVGGNIGVPALELLNEPADLYVLELSSFQLETTSSLKLKAAAFLNLSEDHMDRYDGSIALYKEAKQRIFSHAEFAVVNRDDPQTYPEQPHKNVVTFGLDEKEFGIIPHQGAQWLVANGELLVPVSELSLVGKHNIANVLTVLALLTCAGIDYKELLQTLREYNGLTHRCQVVADQNGIKWVNDSKATNVASTLAALSGLDCSGTLHLLVGGVGKGADFSELAPALNKLDVKLYCFGEDGDEFMSLHKSATRWDNIEQIVKAVSEQVESGDMVMLSPACASFDQFKNFMARGDAFTELAKKYANQ